MGKSQDGGQGQLGVGIVGAGVVVQGIHAPILQGLTDEFTVKAIWDSDPRRAEDLAAHLSTRTAGSFEDLLADPTVDVMLICSPAPFHAPQAIASMRAGKRAVLVEKPLCTTAEEADAIAQTCAETGARLLVGSMHLFDPAWREVQRLLAENPFEISSVRSNIVLPPNSRFEAWSFERTNETQPAHVPLDDRHMMRLWLLELAIHDLPLIRRLLPPNALPRVISARLLSPNGYAVIAKAGDILIDLVAMMHDHWQPEWVLEAMGPRDQLEIAFTPSFVPAGSGRSRIIRKGSWVGSEPAFANGYFAEWQALGQAARDDDYRFANEEFVDDFRFALSIAEQACALLNGGNAK